MEETKINDNWSIIPLIDPVVSNCNSSSMLSLPRAPVQRGKVIGSVVVIAVVVVVVHTKIARIRILGEFASPSCS